MIRNKKGSILVENILMWAFAVAAGGAVIIYGSNVITNAKNTQITGILENNNGNVQEQLDAHFNDSAKTVTLSSTEIANISFTNLSDVPDRKSILSQTSITYKGNHFSQDDSCKSSDTYLCIAYINDNNDSEYINFQWGWDYGGPNNPGSFKWNHTISYYPLEAEALTEGFTWNLGGAYDFFKDTLISDLS